MHVPITIRFLDYIFNENMHNCFHKWNVFLVYLFYARQKKLKNVSLLSLERKNKLLLAQFSIVLANCLFSNLQDHAGLIDKPESFKSKVL